MLSQRKLALHCDVSRILEKMMDKCKKTYQDHFICYLRNINSCVIFVFLKYLYFPYQTSQYLALWNAKMLLSTLMPYIFYREVQSKSDTELDNAFILVLKQIIRMLGAVLLLVRSHYIICQELNICKTMKKREIAVWLLHLISIILKLQPSVACVQMIPGWNFSFVIQKCCDFKEFP